jgi:hypothetical protein
MGNIIMLKKMVKLSNAVSKEVSLSEVLENNDFTIVSFYRVVWCV